MFVEMEEYKGLFKDDAAYRTMIDVFLRAIAKDNSPIVREGKKVLFAALSPEATKVLLTERILKRLSANPELVEEIKDRLEKDAIVE
jgi:hypothetical protein